MRFLWYYVSSVPILMGCGLILDFDPPPLPPIMDGGSDLDAMINPADSGGDGLDSSIADSSVDAMSVLRDGEIPDGFVLDGSFRDGDLPDAGRIDGCEDELGLCLEVSEFAPDRDVLHWRHNVVWTLPGGALFTTDWAAEPCIGGLRHLGDGQTQCLIPIRDPGMEVVGSAVVYAYPVMDDFVPLCTDTTCPGFPSSFRVWYDTVEIPVDAGIGLATLERRPDTPYGLLFCLRIVL
ncbi:hypothetical protein IT407_05165 [Candidatus Uhrbacteria bacterium]|nr:hypothetical protein [Candidatus Uhrbacteria bacterium]